ncbi:hypothetical protein QYE76_000160 [Lolium multiflorum]|uniref:Arabidopsis retrotransposon Orf1 C-terminal domain-containing protein n=1 Tax=Lolium multiflorum TaxID=4521 RepID=A0AAD8VVQ2_LOLMU|nr:hypothetical protein QYE76_000160 [Lolium multiflorum]
MGKPRDAKVAILPSTTRKGTTLSTSAALDSPSVISQLVSPPQASHAGTSAEFENSSYNFNDASTVLDDNGSLGPFLDATIARSRQIENTEIPNENTVTPVNSPESVEHSSDDFDEDYVELDDDFIDKCNATTSDPLYPEGHPKRVEQDSQRTKELVPSKKKKKKHKTVVESSEPVNDPNSISISDAETESGNEHDKNNDKNDVSDKEEVEDEPEKHAKNKKYTKEDFIAKKHGNEREPWVQKQMPFPVKKLKSKEEEHYNKLCDWMKPLFLQIPLTDAIKLPPYSKYMKDIVSNKRKIPNEEISTMLANYSFNGKVPKKLGDPGTAKKIENRPKALMELYREVTNDDSRTIQRGKIRNIQLPAIRYFTYYLATSILGRENTSNISSYHLAFLVAALTGSTPYHLGALIARRLASKGPIYGGIVASRIVAYLGFSIDPSDEKLTPIKLDIAAMKCHQFVTTDSNLENIVYRMLFIDGDEREIPLPQADLFNVHRKPWLRSKEEVDEQLRILGFHQQHDSEDAEPSDGYTVTYPGASSLYQGQDPPSSYYGGATSWAPWD